MVFRIPSFSDLPEINPRPSGTQPVYPAEDPGAAGLAALGKGVSAAGGALANIGEEQRLAQNRLEEAYATSDAKDQIAQLTFAASNETDAAKVTQWRQQMRGVIDTVGKRITDPARRQLWIQNHFDLARIGEKAADQRGLDIWRGNYGAGINEKIANASRRAAQTDNPDVHQAVADDIASLVDAGVAAGVIHLEKAPDLKRQAGDAIITGHADWLDANGRAAQALDFIQRNKERLPPHVLEQYSRRLEGQADRQGGQALADRVRRNVPIAGRMQVGGAIPTRIAQETQKYSNIDTELTLTTADIESSMGQGKDRPGSQYQGVFQMGHDEGRQMGGKDIPQGVKLLAQRKEELTKRLGRPPENWEIYMAHQQGVAGAAQMFENPDEPAGAVAARAGQVSLAVGNERVRANGGNPSAPASAFVQMWRDKYERRAAKFRGADVPVAPDAGGTSSGGFDLAAGDSIAYGAQKYGGLGGKGVADVRSPEAGSSDAAGGRNPQQALDYIKAHPERFRGKRVLWSSGLMNSGSDPGASLWLVGAQIDALKAVGAKPVLVGVDQGGYKEFNIPLKAIADEKGVPFAGPLPTDNVHPGRKGYADYAAAAAKLIGQPQRAQASGAAPDANTSPAQAIGETQPVGAPPLPDIDRQLRDIETDPNASQKQKDIAAAIVTRDFHRQKAAVAAATRQELATVKSLIRDDEASIATTGQPVPQITPERVEATLGADAAEEFAANRATARRFFEQTNDFPNVPQAEIDDRLEAMRPQPGQLGFARNLKAYEAASKRADDLAKLRATDPAAAVSTLPDVQVAAKGASLAKPETYGPLVKARMSAMDRIGIPEENRVPVTRAEALSLWQPIGLATRAGDPREIKAALTGTVQRVQAAFGEHSQIALEAVLREGKSDHETAGVAAAIVRKLTRNELPTPEEARSLDDAQKNGAARVAVEPLLIPQGAGQLTELPPTAVPATAQAAPARRYPAPDAAAIEMLRQSPGTAAAFDQVYGDGASKKALAIAPARGTK